MKLLHDKNGDDGDILQAKEDVDGQTDKEREREHYVNKENIQANYANKLKHGEIVKKEGEK